MRVTALFLIGLLAYCVNGASKSKPHGHNGVLPSYNGKHIAYDIDPEQVKKLNNGEHVRISLPISLYISHMHSLCMSIVF